MNTDFEIADKLKLSLTKKPADKTVSDAARIMIEGARMMENYSHLMGTFNWYNQLMERRLDAIRRLMATG